MKTAAKSQVLGGPLGQERAKKDRGMDMDTALVRLTGVTFIVKTIIRGGNLGGFHEPQ